MVVLLAIRNIFLGGIAVKRWIVLLSLAVLFLMIGGVVIATSLPDPPDLISPMETPIAASPPSLIDGPSETSSSNHNIQKTVKSENSTIHRASFDDANPKKDSSSLKLSNKKNPKDLSGSTSFPKLSSVKEGVEAIDMPKLDSSNGNSINASLPSLSDKNLSEKKMEKKDGPSLIPVPDLSQLNLNSQIPSVSNSPNSEKKSVIPPTLNSTLSVTPKSIPMNSDKKEVLDLPSEEPNPSLGVNTDKLPKLGIEKQKNSQMSPLNPFPNLSSNSTAGNQANRNTIGSQLTKSAPTNSTSTPQSTVPSLTSAGGTATGGTATGGPAAGGTSSEQIPSPLTPLPSIENKEENKKIPAPATPIPPFTTNEKKQKEIACPETTKEQKSMLNPSVPTGNGIGSPSLNPPLQNNPLNPIASPKEIPGKETGNTNGLMPKISEDSSTLPNNSLPNNTLPKNTLTTKSTSSVPGTSADNLPIKLGWDKPTEQDKQYTQKSVPTPGSSNNHSARSTENPHQKFESKKQSVGMPSVGMLEGANGGYVIPTPAFNEVKSMPLNDKFPGKVITDQFPRDNSSIVSPNREISPSISIETIVPEMGILGKPLQYEMIVKNRGQVPVHQVHIEDQLPGTMRYLGGTPVGEMVGEKIQWSLGDLDVGAEKRIQVSIKPVKGGEIKTQPQVMFRTKLMPVVIKIAQAQLELIASSSQKKVHIGDEISFHFEITNRGAVTAEEVLLRVQLSEGIDHPQAKSQYNRVIEALLYHLEPGKTREVTLKAKAAKGGAQFCLVNVQSEGVSTPSQRIALEITKPIVQLKLIAPAKVLVNAVSDVEIQANNLQEIPTKPLQIALAFPQGLDIVSTGEGANYDRMKRVVYWNPGEVNSKGMKSLIMRVKANQKGNWGIRGVGRVGSSEDIRVERAILVEGIPGINFEVVNRNNPCEIGKEASFEIKIMNQGTADCTHLNLKIHLSSGLVPTNISSQREVLNYKFEGQTLIFEPIAKLAGKEDLVIRVLTKGIKAGDQRCKVEVNCDQLSQPLFKEEGGYFYDPLNQ